MTQYCTHPDVKTWQQMEAVQWCTVCGAIRLLELDDAWTEPSHDPGTSAFLDTISGRRINLLDPRPEDVLVSDIAHQLSMQVRFNGAIPFFYGVGEHCFNVAMATYFLMGGSGGPSGNQLLHGLECPADADPRKFWGALLRAQIHDGSEGPLGDCIRPLKELLPFYQRLEALHMRAIHTALGFGPDEDWTDIDEIIDQVDKQTCAVEHHILRGGPEAVLPGVSIRGLDWEVAKGLFLDLAQQLVDKFEPYRETRSAEIVAS